MLHEVTEDGGLGFCYVALPNLLPLNYHGPLIIALDSNILIDFRQYGNLLLNGDLPSVNDAYAKDLAGLSNLLNTWLLRDIRFIVTPRSLTDARKVTKQFLDRHLPTVEAIAESLAFQFGDWTIIAPSYADVPTFVGRETGLPRGADRDLVLEAQVFGAHVFLTRDQRILERTTLSGPAVAIIPPHALAGELTAAEVGPFSGGTCGAESCPYINWPLLAPDMGKWHGVLSIFQD